MIACATGVVLLTALTLWMKPRFDRVAARRDEIGDVDMPPGRLARVMAVGMPAVIAAIVIPLVWNTDAGLIVGVVVLAGAYWLIIGWTLHEAEAAQRRAVR